MTGFRYSRWHFESQGYFGVTAMQIPRGIRQKTSVFTFKWDCMQGQFIVLFQKERCEKCRNLKQGGYCVLRFHCFSLLFSSRSSHSGSACEKNAGKEFSSFDSRVIVLFVRLFSCVAFASAFGCGELGIGASCHAVKESCGSIGRSSEYRNTGCISVFRCLVPRPF